MEIVVRKRGGLQGHKLTVSEKESLLRKKRDLEAIKGNLSFESLKDPHAVESELKQIDEKIARDDGLAAKGKEKDVLNKKRENLALHLKTLVPPLYIQEAKPGTPEYHEALRWGNEAMKPEVVNKCLEYKEICQRLEPDNPFAGSITDLVSNK